MLPARYLERYADVLLWALNTARRKHLKKGDIVLLRYHRTALTLAEIIHGRLVAKGMHVVQRLLPTPVMEKNFYHAAANRQLVFLDPGENEIVAGGAESPFRFTCIVPACPGA